MQLTKVLLHELKKPSTLGEKYQLIDRILMPYQNRLSDRDMIKIKEYCQQTIERLKTAKRIKAFIKG